MDRADTYRAILTAAIFLVFGGVVLLTGMYVNTAPTIGEENAVLLDPFKNASTLLTVVASTATLVFGYWFGASGKEKAETKADQTQGALTSVLAKSEPSANVEISELHKQFPAAFGLKK